MSVYFNLGSAEPNRFHQWYSNVPQDHRCSVKN